MKEFRVSMRIRNNRLVALREAEGWSQRQAGEYIGIGGNMLSAFECMRRNAWQQDGDITPTGRKIANFYDVDPEWLFPRQVDEVKHHVLDMTVDGRELVLMRERSAMVLDAVERMALADFNGERCADVLRARFVDEVDLVEAGGRWGTSRERTRQIEAQALNKLRKDEKILELK